MAIRDLIKRNGNTSTSNVPVKWEPNYSLPTTFTDIDNWMNRWNQWFDNLFARNFGSAPTRDLGWPWASGLGTFVPAVNVSTGDNEIRVTAELPGMDEKDVEVFVNQGALTIQGHKKSEKEDSSGDYYRMERSYGEFRRTIPLPQEVDQDKVMATFSRGVLSVTLPKLHEPQPGAKTISIKTSD
jgi:HSP20 family protein